MHCASVYQLKSGGFYLLLLKPTACARNGLESAAVGIHYKCNERFLRAAQKSLSSSIDLGCSKYSCSCFSYSISQLPSSSLNASCWPSQGNNATLMTNIGFHGRFAGKFTVTQSQAAAAMAPQRIPSATGSCSTAEKRNQLAEN